MISFQTVHRSLIIILLLLIVSMPTIGQSKSDNWLRIFTDEDSVMEINRLSLIVEPDQVIKAQFRTVFMVPELMLGKPDVKYSTRLDSIQFSAKLGGYKTVESSYLDDSGRTVASTLYPAETRWKPLSWRAGRRLYSAASQLRPFGFWRVVNYRYASGERPSKDDPPELKSLVGQTLHFEPGRIAVGNESCTNALIDPRTITDEEFQKLTGSSLSMLGFSSGKVDAIRIACNSTGSVPNQTFILRTTDKTGLMLWQGVFLELERPPNPFNP